MTEPEKLTYSVPEIAVAIGVSEWSVWRLINTGQLPVMRIGGRTLMSVERLKEWVNGQHDKEAS